MDYILELPHRLNHAKSLEDILCLSVLIASERLLPDATISDSGDYYNNTVNTDCGACPFVDTCLACIINK